ncbi:P-loop containing nucleoside triphosphate hydrolase protein [Mycena alexandri]|uniref:small monomeric GTPase n=1 Tax=Mycena alexandri TaxID=1745969 RepID=A0AAD6SQA1_9AGAR|nr:P-loop containing nucleoside triphosphate hydrolase protein [Mycena alexandri]
MNTDYDRDAWTIALVGAPGIGKTRFISRFVLDDFEVRGRAEDLEGSTKQGFSRKLTIDGQNTIVTLLDVYSAPIALNDNAVDAVLRDADGFILMYSTTSPYSLQDVVAYTRAVRRAKAAEPVLLLVANQRDRPAQDQEVSRREGEALARELDCPFTEVSAKTGDGVDDAVGNLVRALRANTRRSVKKQGRFWGYLTRR